MFILPYLPGANELNHCTRPKDHCGKLGACPQWTRLMILWFTGALRNTGYPSEKHIIPKSRKILFAHNSCLSWPIVLEFCTEQDSITAVFHANFQTNQPIEMDVMDEQNFLRFEFERSFGRIAHTAQNPWFLLSTIRVTSCHAIGYRRWYRWVNARKM